MTHDDETVRYLASYICQHSNELLTASFDRNASHSAGEYREYISIYEKGLYDLICKFYDELP